MRKEKKEKLNKSAASGVVALIFLILGFQLAIFVVKVVERPAVEDPVHVDDAATHTDSVRIVLGSSRQRTKYGGYGPPSETHVPAGPSRRAARSFESFPFDPNTVSVEDLVRLGLTQRQAEAVDNYRSKGGRFREKSDFGKMYTVSDTLYQRLEPYIEIAKIELNAADSTALVTLRGIGGYYATRILGYRESLGGFVRTEQLMEIKGIDSERYDGFADNVCVDCTLVRHLDIWHLPQDSLSRHPYVGEKMARAVVRYRSVYDSTRWCIDSLLVEHVLDSASLGRLRPYLP